MEVVVEEKSSKCRSRLVRVICLSVLALGVFPLVASAQFDVLVSADTYLRLDLDGDGFDDIPLPPVGTPTVLPLNQGSTVVEFETVASNGLSVTTAIDIEGGSTPIDEPANFITGAFGRVTVGMNDIEVPVGGFAIGRFDAQTEIPVRFVSDTGGFTESQVAVEVTASVDGSIRYTQPTLAGFILTTTFVAEDDDEFAVASGSFTDTGSRSGAPEFLGANSVYSYDAPTDTATWQLTNVQSTLLLDQPLTLGATFQDSSITFKQFKEIASTNFFGAGPVTAGGTFVFEYAPNGGQLVSIRSLTPGVSVELAVPEPATGLALLFGLPALSVLARRRRSPRADAARPRRGDFSPAGAWLSEVYISVVAKGLLKRPTPALSARQWPRALMRGMRSSCG